MGSSQTKEEVVIAQNAAGGSNGASVALEKQLSITNIILGILGFVMLVMVAVMAYKMCFKCQKKMIDKRVERHATRRSFLRRQRQFEASEQV